MARLYKELVPDAVYVDKKSGYTKEKWVEACKVSRTLYVGNLSFFTNEDQIHELFSRCGEVKKVVMGLNRFKKSPCGFCFVEYFTHEQAAQAVNLLNKTMFDERLIRVDWDAGLTDGRQYGRGESGDQWRDDFRDDYDVARGGQGRNLLRQIEGQPDRQVYVGKRRQSHGRFGEPEAKRARHDDAGAAGAAPVGFGVQGIQGLPMTFGAQPTFGMGFPMGGMPGPPSGGKGKPRKGKGKGKGKDRDRGR
eukprot:TRINITY_DN3861_c0_g1_i1.p1 TRINITY_DN3861_c0_g1~~TRINITY_DN3861_c0_g1_i1.p1  ORF type:complete len:275 (-),score=64.00 TRINITY_DN3861_c0_g1_i1:112-858(-)